MPTIAITSLDQVPRYAQAGINHIISIGNEDQPRPDISLFARDFTLHRFVFDDVSAIDIYPKGPTRAIVEHLLKVYSIIEPDANVLFHCMAGISRSTAACFLYAVSRGASYEEAYRLILAIRGVVQPNMLMIHYADVLMGRKGEMLAFVAKASGRPHMVKDYPAA